MPKMDTQYLDFELELGAGTSAGNWPLSVIQSPGGQGRGMLSLPDAPEQIAVWALKADLQEVRRLGEMLFERLLLYSGIYGQYTEGLGIADAKGMALRIKLRITDSQLAIIPWEIMYENRVGEFVVLSHETPLVRYAEAAKPQTPLTVQPPMRILGVAASPTDLEPIDIPGQMEAVQNALNGLIVKGLVDLVWMEGCTWRKLQQVLRGGGQWHVLHFLGHGMVNKATGEGAVAFADDNGTAHLLGASELGRILATHKPLRLALLNACHSGTPSAVDLYTSAAATLIRRGLPAVIAMQFGISHASAAELARTFYESLADGLPVEGALTHARIALSLAQSNTLDWAAPVLYLRAPDGVLFEMASDKAVRTVEDGSDEVDGQSHAQLFLEPIQAAAKFRLSKPIRSLSGSQFSELQSAMLAAYPRRNLLRQMVRIQLQENLDGLVGEGDMMHLIFELIEWSERTGRLSQLIEGAVNGVPDNWLLREFVERNLGNS
jgi:hypothetical protein